MSTNDHGNDNNQKPKKTQQDQSKQNPKPKNEAKSVVSGSIGKDNTVNVLHSDDAQEPQSQPQQNKPQQNKPQQAPAAPNAQQGKPVPENEAKKKPKIQAPAGSTLKDRFFDPLLESLVVITQLKQRPYSAESLKTGLPLVNNLFTPDTFVRAAERAGLSARMVKRPLTEVKNILLPAVLLLREGGAAVLVKIDKEQCHIIYPETGVGETIVPLNEIEEQYTGYLIFVQVMHDFEKRAEEDKYIPKARNWFWGTIWKFKSYYGQVILASLFINIFALATPLFIMNVYDRVVPNNALETLWVLAIGAIIVFVFDFILRTLRGLFIDLAGKKVDTILASNLFEQMLGIKMLEQAESTGVQANHLRDFENVRDFFTSATIASIVDLPFVFLFLWIILMLGGPIVIVPMIAIPLVIITAILLSIPLNRAVGESFVGGAQKNAIVIEALNNLEVIKSSTAEGALLSRWEKYVGLNAKAGIKSRFYSMLAVNFCMVMTYVVTAVVVIMGVYRIEQKFLTVGGLIACTILSGRAMAPLSQVTALLTRYQLTKYSLDALNQLMQKPIDRPLKQKFLHRPSFEGDIEFEDVVFRYPGQELDLFKGISFRINAKEKVGVIGGMGSGKTTLIKLLIGFYQPTSGAIRIDGTDIAQIDPADLRRYTGFVPQDPKLFFGTARENIAMKAPWADDIEILNCARISGADKFISRHPAGYDMPIGEGGKGLSGGQGQTITIARSLLTSPSILLFDEPTSCMDNSTERMFVENMNRYIQDKTMVLVTHKMSLLQLVDRLIVLQNGKIVADGPKAKVLEALRHMNKPEEETAGAKDGKA